MDEKREKRLSYLLMISLCLVFAFSIGIKAVYRTAIIEIREEYALTNFETNIGTLIYYIVYAVAQITLAVVINKINMKKVFFYSVILSSIAYSCTLFADSAWKLWLLMGINGVLQAPHWSGCIYFIARLLKQKYISSASKFMTVSNPIGTAFTIGTVSLLMFLNAWKLSFAVLAALMTASAFLFKFVEGKLEEVNKTAESTVEKRSGKERKATELIRPGKKQKAAIWITIIFLALMSMLINGLTSIVSTCLPLYLFDLHGLDRSLSTLITIFLPILSAFAQVGIFSLCYKWRNYSLIQLAAAVVSLLMIVPLYFVYRNYIIITLIIFISFSCIIGSVSGINSTIFSIDLRKKVDSGAISAVLNAGAALGCALMPTISGAMLDLGGTKSWNTVMIFLFSVTAAVAIIITGILLTKSKNYAFSDSDNIV